MTLEEFIQSVNMNGVLDDDSVHFYMRACDSGYAQIPKAYTKMITITPIKGNDISSFIMLYIQTKIIEILASKALIAPTLVKTEGSSNNDQKNKTYKGNAQRWTFDVKRNKTRSYYYEKYFNIMNKKQKQAFDEQYKLWNQWKETMKR